MHHYVQTAAVAHGHDGRLRAVFGGSVQNRGKQGNQRRDAFQRKSLRAEIARLQDLLEEVRANQALENFVLVDFFGRGFEALNNPAAPIRLRQMHEVRAHGAAVDAARFFGGLAC